MVGDYSPIKYMKLEIGGDQTMKVCSKKFPSVIYEAKEHTSDGSLIELTPIQLIEGYHKEGTTLENIPVKVIKKVTFKRTYQELNEVDASSMRHNRSKKIRKARPFVPNPYFLRQSMISSYLQCPDKFYDTYENGYSEDTIYTKMGTAIHGVMEDYYTPENTESVPELFNKWWANHGPDQPELYEEWKGLVTNYFDHLAGMPDPNILALELEFKSNIAGIPVSGTIDRIDRINENTVLIIDYKSNQMPYTPAELKQSIQFKFYSLVLMTPELHNVLGEYENIICAYDMLRTGKRQYVTYTKEELEIFRDWLLIIWARMLNGKERNPKLNKYCSHCQKRHKCDSYQEMLKSPTSIVATEDLDMDKIAEDLDMLKQSKKMIEGRIAEIEGIVKNKIIENGGPTILNGIEWSMKSSKTTSYPILKILDLVGQDKQAQDEVMSMLGSLSATAIKKIKSLKPYKDKLEDIAEEAYKSPSLYKREAKSDNNNESKN